MQKLLRYGWCVLLFLAVALPAAALGGDASFKPELVGVELASREVRPGDPFALTLKFRNAGTKPAPADYWLFVHFETAEDCRNIAIHADPQPGRQAHRRVVHGTDLPRLRRLADQAAGQGVPRGKRGNRAHGELNATNHGNPGRANVFVERL